MCHVDPRDLNELLSDDYMRQFVGSFGDEIVDVTLLMKGERRLIEKWNAVMMCYWNLTQSTTQSGVGPDTKVRILEIAAVWSLELKSIMHEWSCMAYHQEIYSHMQGTYKILFLRDVVLRDFCDLCILASRPFAEEEKAEGQKDEKTKAKEEVKRESIVTGKQ